MCTFINVMPVCMNLAINIQRYNTSNSATYHITYISVLRSLHDIADNSESPDHFSMDLNTLETPE